MHSERSYRRIPQYSGADSDRTRARGAVYGKAQPLFFKSDWRHCAQHFIYAVIIELIFFGIVGSSEYLWLQLLAYAAFAAAVYLIMYLLFTPNLKRRRHLYVQDSWRNCAVLVVFLVIFLASTFINQANAWGGYEGVNYLSIASDIINCVFVVAVQYVSLRNARLRNEKDLAIHSSMAKRSSIIPLKTPLTIST